MSEITAITAGIGGGKTLRATQIAFKELLKGHRFIVTNAPLDLEQMRYDYYCIKKEKMPENRIRLLTFEETRRWWLYLPGRDLASIEEVAQRQTQDSGCVYILDEFHLVYPARDWAKTAAEIGPDVEVYVSQLRKVNDDLYWITQHREKVDKNFRRNTTDWCVVKNLGKARLLLGVGMPNRFVASHFPQEPVGKDKPEYTVFYERIVKINGYTVDYGKQYRTMGGIGFQGAKEAEDKPKRRHWSIWIVAALALGVLAWFIPRLFSEGAGKFIGYSTGNFATSIKKSAGVPDVSLPQKSLPGAAVPGAATGGASVPQTSAPVVAIETNEVFVCGYDFLLGYPRVMLSDGRMLKAERINKYEGAWVKGRQYKMRLGPINSEYKPERNRSYATYGDVQKTKQYKVLSVGPNSSREFYPTGGSIRQDSAEGKRAVDRTEDRGQGDFEDVHHE